MSSGIESLGNDGVDPGFKLSLGLASAAHKAPDQTAALVGGVEKEGRATEPRGDDGHSFLEQNFELSTPQRLAESAPLVEVDGFLGHGDVVFLHDHLFEFAMGVGNF